MDPQSIPNLAAAAAMLVLPLLAWRLSKRAYATRVVALLALPWAGFHAAVALRENVASREIGSGLIPIFAMLVPVAGMYTVLALFRPRVRDRFHVWFAAGLAMAGCASILVYAWQPSWFGPPATTGRPGFLAASTGLGLVAFGLASLGLSRSLPDPPSPWSGWAFAHAATGFFLAPAFTGASTVVGMVADTDYPDEPVFNKVLAVAALLPLTLAFLQLLRVRTVSAGTSLRGTLSGFLLLLIAAPITGLLGGLIYVASPDDGIRMDRIAWATWTSLGVFFIAYAYVGSSRAPIASSERFETVRELGVGAYGKAILARDRVLDREVVLKQPTGEWLLDAEQRALFLREARLIARIHHTNVVTVHEVLAEEKPPLLVLEYMEGGSLRDLLREGGHLPTSEVSRIAAEVLDGLGAIHAAGVIHRDLKPANILLTATGHAKVTDFGVARSAASQHDMTLAATGYQPGTAMYMSPEQARGDAVEARSDLYSVGVIICEMLTGESYLPLSRKTDFEVRRLIQEEVPRITHPRIPPTMRRFLEKSLAKAPSHRFPDAINMRNALIEMAGAGDPRAPGSGGRRPRAGRSDTVSS